MATFFGAQSAAAGFFVEVGGQGGAPLGVCEVDPGLHAGPVAFLIVWMRKLSVAGGAAFVVCGQERAGEPCRIATGGNVGAKVTAAGR